MASQTPGLVHDVPIELQRLVETVADRLRELDQLKVLVGEVPGKLPADKDGRVYPYAVIWPTVPAPSAGGRDLADSHLERDWPFQVTVAAGWMPTLLDRADQVHAQLHRWAPSYDVDGRLVVCSGLQVPPGYQPSVGLDRDVNPPRHYVPLQYRTTATT